MYRTGKSQNHFPRSSFTGKASAELLLTNMEEHLAVSVATSLANTSAEERRKSGVATPLCGAVDLNWVASQRHTLRQSQSELSGLQAQLRFSTELSDELECLVLERDVARHTHINRIAEVLHAHERRHLPERIQVLASEATGLQEALGLLPTQLQVGSALTKRIRLTRLCGDEKVSHSDAPLLNDLRAWDQEVAHFRAELDDLKAHGGGVPPSVELLHELHETWESAMDALVRAQSDTKLRRPPADAASKVHEARRAVQIGEHRLRKERTRLATLASAHFPELYVREPLLRLGADDGEVLQGLLVGREFEHYSGPDGGAEPVLLGAARHDVYRCAPPLTTPTRRIPLPATNNLLTFVVPSLHCAGRNMCLRTGACRPACSRSTLCAPPRRSRS
jgi:hypothetical protein